VSFSQDAKKVLTLLFGLVVTASGGFFLWRVMQVTPIDRHLVYVGAGWIAVGCLIVAPKVLFNALKQLVSLLPSIRIGGNGAPPAR
jgi:hypothetical protein